MSNGYISLFLIFVEWKGSRSNGQEGRGEELAAVCDLTDY